MRYSTSFILICFNHNFSSSICYQCYLQASERIFTSTYLFLLPLIIILEGVSFFPLYLPVSFPCHRPSLLFFSFMSFFLPLFFSRPFLLLIRVSSLLLLGIRQHAWAWRNVSTTTYFCNTQVSTLENVRTCWYTTDSAHYILLGNDLHYASSAFLYLYPHRKWNDNFSCGIFKIVLHC